MPTIVLSATITGNRDSGQAGEAHACKPEVDWRCLASARTDFRGCVWSVKLVSAQGVHGSGSANCRKLLLTYQGSNARPDPTAPKRSRHDDA